MEHVVILGAGYGGLTCALRLARRARRLVKITLVNASDRFVERIRLHQLAAAQRRPDHDLRRMLRGTGVHLHVGRADAIDVERQTLRVGTDELHWDTLVLALGSHVDLGTVPGVREHAHALDGGRVEKLAQTLASLRGTRPRVAVVGTGLTGIEAATEIAEHVRDAEVKLIGGRIADGWSPGARAHLTKSLARLGVALHEGVRVRRVEHDHLVTDGESIAFDVCVWAAGFAFPALPREAGLAVTPNGQVLVDPGFRSISHPLVYAVGDIASPLHAPGHPLPLGCKSAMPTGAHVADNIARRLHGRAEQPLDFAMPFHCVSLGRRDGLIQFPDRDGALTGRVLTGRAGAWFKEMICKGTVWSLRMERVGIRAVVWFKTGRVRELAVTDPPLLRS